MNREVTALSSIRILLVDDHIMVRRGLTTLLSLYDDVAVVGEAANGLDAIELCQQLQPDVVLMDMRMPGMDGAAATSTIRERCPNAVVIAMSSYSQRDIVLEALNAGATGYILKDVSPDELHQSIRSAYAGQVTLSPQVAQALIRPREDYKVLDEILTDRELEVLTLMVEAMSNTAIAERLHVSLPTVKTHVSNILAKLGVSNRTEAVTLALSHGMTRPSS
jgi:NarL family two-component system response regulator LiaR